MDRTPLEESVHWLKTWHGSGGAYSIDGFTIDGAKQTATRVFTDHDEAARYAHILDDMGYEGVYFRTSTIRPDAMPAPGRRGAAAASASLPGFLFDLDRHWGGKTATSPGGPMPSTWEQWEAVRESAGLPPYSVIVESGGGFYGGYLFDAPLDLSTPDGMARGVALVGRAYVLMAKHAKALGWWGLDQTKDLARVFGVPGTVNRKAVNGEPVRRHVIKDDGPVYSVSQIEDLLSAPAPIAATPAPRAPQSSLFAGPDAYEPSTPVASGQSSLFAPETPRAPSNEHDWNWYRTEHLDPALAEARTPTRGFNNALNHLAYVMGKGVGTVFAEENVRTELAKVVREVWQADPDRDDLDTIESGLAKGMSAPWVIHGAPWQIEAAAPELTAETSTDAVDALLAEMISFEQVSEIPPPRYLIHGLLQFDSESWIIGAPGSKKSFVALDMAARVARGETTWQGRRVNPADVVMIVAEGAGGMGKRVKAWSKRYGKVTGIRVLPRPVQSAGRALGALHVTAEWRVLAMACERLAQAAREAGRGLLVVIDTQARVTVGMNENAADDMGVYVEAVRLIREKTGACVLTVHHTGRDGQNARGSSAVDGAQTSELKVESRPKTLTAKLKTEKQKDIEELGDLDLAFEVVDLGQDLDGDPVNSLVLAEIGTAAFRAAWSKAGADVGQEIEKQETPFNHRETVERWIAGIGDPKASTQRWIVQALVDTAETVGLVESKVKEIVDGRRGKVDASTFRKAWQKVTEDGGAWSEVVVSAGGQRWTVDRLSVSRLSVIATDG